MLAMQQLQLEVIDIRSWNPRGIDSTLVSEAYVRCHHISSDDDAVVDGRSADISAAMTAAINQPLAKIKVMRWHPGALPAAVVEQHDGSGDTEPVDQEGLQSKVLDEVSPSEARGRKRRGSMMNKTAPHRTIMRVAGSATSAMRKPQTHKRVRNDDA
jgi:post-segregation antitoxin (ccd killing protein)